MSTDDQIDRGMEQHPQRLLRRSLSRELEAPADTWARLERRLDPPRRFDWFGGNMWKILTAGAGTVAAAVLVIVVINLAGDSSTAVPTPMPVGVSAQIQHVNPRPSSRESYAR